MGGVLRWFDAVGGRVKGILARASIMERTELRLDGVELNEEGEGL